MTAPAPPRGPRALRLLVPAVPLAWAAAQAVRLALLHRWSIDEFQYAHAAWLVARGQRPYADFFEVHAPLVYQALAPVFLLAGDAPAAVVWLRAGMLAFAALAMLAAARLGGRGVAGAPGWLAPVLMIALPQNSQFMTEIRPDAAASALLVASLAACGEPRLGPRARGAAAGALAVLAFWASQKVGYTAPLFALALAIDVLANARRRDGYLLGDPRAFVAGALAAAVPPAAWLLASGAAGAWWRWAFVWAVEHERQYPGFPFTQYFGPIVAEAPWLFLLALVGAGATAARLVRERAGRDPDLLALGALVTTFLSFALQRAPFPYSFLPFLALCCVFAARGAGWLFHACGRLAGGRALAARGALAAALAVALVAAHARLERLIRPGNAAQNEILAQIGALTAPGDCVYDNAGAAVARPHAHFFFYTDAWLRWSERERLAREVPAGILERGCVLRVDDLRTDGLPAALRRFLAQNYQPRGGDLHLWGRRYESTGAALEAEFLAVQEARYFVEPASVLRAGTLTIDGAAVTEPVFALRKGAHALRWEGPPATFHVLWLPRDGRRWTPAPGPRTFSSLF